MKLSLSWIRDYVKIPEDADLKKLAYDLTMSTVEVEDVEYLARRFDNMVVGVIEKIEPHPNADKLRVCQVNIGSDVKTIVCGGINLREGMRVAVSCPGAIVRWHGQGEPVEIKNSKLRGVESYGMICASDEIGLGDLFPASQEAEILDLSAFEVPAGTPLATALDLDDVLLEIDNKSMTNRPDLWGHYGIAREIAALYNLPLMEIEPYRAETQSDFKVEIESPDRCARYIGVEMNGVEVKPSPYKMQSRIWKAGMRPINALVDITNYVMLATGNPTHAFDADIVSALGLPERLFEKRISQPGETVGPLKAEIAAEVGCDMTAVLCATHDTASAVLAAPVACDFSSPYISSGTWSLLGVEQERAHTDADSMRENFSNEGGPRFTFRWQKNIMGLWILQSARRELGLDFAAAEALARANACGALVDCNDEIFLAPESMCAAVREKAGDLTDGQLLYCIYASLADCYKRALRAMEEKLGKKFGTLNVIGGGSRDKLLNELTARAAGVKVMAGPAEATALGNLMVQMIAGGEIKDIGEGREMIGNTFPLRTFE